jgi:hypothetical protein
MADLLMRMPVPYEPLRKNRFILRFPDELGIQEWWVSTTSRPKYTSAEVEIPFLNTSSVRSSKFRPIFSVAYWFLVSDFLILGWVGQKPVESPYIEIGMGATIFYFVFILFLVPLIGLFEKKITTHQVL